MARIEIKSLGAPVAAKGLALNFSGGGATYEKWGSDHFTKPGNSSGAFSNSGYIAAALRWKCEQFAQAPFCVVQDSKGRVDKMEGHPLLPLLRYPGGTRRGAMTRSELFTRGMRSIELAGNCYFYILLNGFGVPAGLRYLPFWAVTPGRYPESANAFDFYDYSLPGGRIIRIPADRIIHWKLGEDPNDENLGCSPLKSVLREYLTEVELSNYTKTMTANKGEPRRAIFPEDADDNIDWDDEFVEGMKAKYEQASDNDLLVLDRHVGFYEFGATPDKMVIDKIAIIPKEKILGVMAVDPALVHMTVGFPDSKGTDKKELLAIGWKSALMPLGTSLCERLTIDLLPAFGDVQVQRVELDLSVVWALQEDLNKVHDRTQKDFLANVITQNEARERYQLDPRDGGDKTHNEFPQLINGNADATLLNGTNDKLPNETDRSQRSGTQEV